MLCSIQSGAQITDEADRRGGDDGPGRIDRIRTSSAQVIKVLGRDNTADDDHEVLAPERVKLLAQSRHEREVTGGERRDTDHVHVGLDGLTCNLGRRLEQRSHVDVETKVGKRGGDDLLPTVVTVLAHLGHEDARAATLRLFEVVDELLRPAHVGVGACLVGVHATDRTDLGRVAAECLLHRRGHLPHRGHRPGRVDRERQQVGVERSIGTGLGSRGETLKRHPAYVVVALCPQTLQFGNLRRADRRVVDLEDLERLVAIGHITVDADDRLLARVDARLGASGRLLDPHLGDAGLDRLGHAASGFDLLDVGPGPLGKVVGEPLDVGRTGPRVDGAGRARLLLDDELGVAGDTRTEVGGQRDRLVESIGVQALREPLRRGHRLDAGADDVVVDVLSRERPATRLAVGAQAERLRVCGALLLHEARPEQAGRAHLGDLHEEVHADGPEEGQARGKTVDVEADALACPEVLDAVGQRVGELEILRGSSLLHVVAGDGDRVVARHLLGRERKDVADDAHRGLGRIDVGVADHELFEDVVLDGPRELLGRDALLLRRHDEEREHGDDRAVHRHRHRHLVERNAVKEGAHVIDRVDGHSGHADITLDARVVAVVATVGGEVEGDTQTLLARRQVATIERVGLLSGGEPGVLADRPRLVDIHRRVGAAQERRRARDGLEEVEALEVGIGVERRHLDLLRGEPCLGAKVRTLRVGARTTVAKIDTGEVRDRAHAGASISSRRAERNATTSMPLLMPP